MDTSSLMLKTSRSGYNLVKNSNAGSRLYDFFPERCIDYWNKIPEYVKDANTVNSFKGRLELYKSSSSSTARMGNYWELSDILFSKIESDSREDYVQYLKDNPGVAARRMINLD